MKSPLKKSIAAVLGALLFASVAWAAVPWTSINLNQWVKNRFYVGPAATVGTDSNHVDAMLAPVATSIDFAGVTDQCEDSSAITVTGAAVGDPCSVGKPATMPCAHCWLDCYVSAANAVKVRLCAHGASGNPAAANYQVRTISSP